MTQPTIWHVQAAHLALMNWQMAHAQQQQAWQANLHQVLHETEQMARRVDATRTKDSFAAAVLAQGWLRRVSGLDTNHFQDVAAKRAWSDAWNCLDGAVRAERLRNAATLDAYFVHADALAGFHERLGQDPRGILAALVAQRDREKPMHLLGGAGVCFVGGLLLVMLAAKTSAGPVLFFLCTGVAVYLAWLAYKAHQKRSEISRRLATAETDAANYERFMQDPNAGIWLRQTWGAHPLLFEIAVPDAPAPSSGTSSSTYVERKVVERQVVVVRCKYCKQYAPVDKPTCEHCGAAGYGSST
jgi:hypothetical protein